MFDHYEHFNIQLLDMNFDIILSKYLLQKHLPKKFPLRHMHKSWELYYIKNGCIDVDFENERKVFGANCFVFIPPNTEHCIISASEDIEYYSIRFSYTYDPKQMLTAEINQTLMDRSLMENPITDEVQRTFEILKSNYKRYVNGNPSIWLNQRVSISCMSFWLAMIESISGKMQMWKKKTASEEENLTLILEFFTEQYDNITVAKLAEALNYSVSQTNRILKSRFGMSFQELHNDMRLRKAKYYLTKTTLPVEEISRIVGFKEKKYFNRFFKALVGITPLQYRRTNSQQ